MSERYAIIIDDTPTGIKVLAQFLETVGFQHVSLQNPARIYTLQEQLPQCAVVFVDLEMPNLTGYDVLNILKNELAVTAPVIAYSVHTSEVATAQEMGFDGFLGKPINMKLFEERFNRILAGEAVWEID